MRPRAAQLPGSHGKRASDLLPPRLSGSLLAIFSRRQVEYIAHILSPDELNVIADLHDALILARIKRMPPAKLARFDQYVPVDRSQQKTYEMEQVRWIRDEEYLLGQRLGRRPSPHELCADFMRCQNGLRFRAYYTLKFPQRMRSRESRQPAMA